MKFAEIRENSNLPTVLVVVRSTLIKFNGSGHELGVVEVVIRPAGGEQRRVIALLDDSAALHHEDRVGIPNRGEAMGEAASGGVKKFTRS